MNSCMENQFVSAMQYYKHPEYMILTICVNSSNEQLKELYIESARRHNEKIINDARFYDAGFDLFLPENVSVKKNLCNKIDFQIKCCAEIYTGHSSRYTSYYTYARSSISKTIVRLANNQGIIDAGYRGNIIGMFDAIQDGELEAHIRLLQICSPSLMPIYVKIASTFDELGPSTERGENGIGSTGK